MSAHTPSKRPRDPGSVHELERRLDRHAVETKTTKKRLHPLVANVVLAQMLPGSAVKGGTGLKLRFGDRMTRATPDLDTAFRGDRNQFVTDLADNLATGWGGFHGTVREGTPRPPRGVPTAYVMQPLIVQLTYGRGRRNFAKVIVEVGYDELEATTNEPAERHLAQEVLDLFVELGLAAPEPIPVLPLHHQIAQKLHACTEPGNERAHDLVDLQLMAPLADDPLVADTVNRLFRFRKQHRWPSPVVPSETWESLYSSAVEGLKVAKTVKEAADWTNGYITRLAAM